MIVALVFVVLRTEVLESCAEFVLKEIFNYHFACYGFLQMCGCWLFDNFIQIFVLQSSPHLFLFYIILEFIFLPS